MEGNPKRQACTSHLVTTPSGPSMTPFALALVRRWRRMELSLQHKIALLLRTRTQRERELRTSPALLFGYESHGTWPYPREDVPPVGIALGGVRRPAIAPPA